LFRVRRGIWGLEKGKGREKSGKRKREKGKGGGSRNPAVPRFFEDQENGKRVKAGAEARAAISPLSALPFSFFLFPFSQLSR
jgi:hypothetical protein